MAGDFAPRATRGCGVDSARSIIDNGYPAVGTLRQT
jgi:hypothetical protein